MALPGRALLRACPVLFFWVVGPGRAGRSGAGGVLERALARARVGRGGFWPFGRHFCPSVTFSSISGFADNDEVGVALVALVVAPGGSYILRYV